MFIRSKKNISKYNLSAKNFGDIFQSRHLRIHNRKLPEIKKKKKSREVAHASNPSYLGG
jgi:hypothetical protein